MGEVGRRHFGQAIGLGLHASENKEENLKEIFNVIKLVKEDLESFTDNKVSLAFRDSQKHAMLKAAVYLSTFDSTTPLLQHPMNQVIFALSTTNRSKVEDLTLLELGPEGFPCTIYIDGNRHTSADLKSFEDNIEALLSSPSTGEKIKSLMNIEAEKHNVDINEAEVKEFNALEEALQDYEQAYYKVEPKSE